jgi:hypothetical protein
MLDDWAKRFPPPGTRSRRQAAGDEPAKSKKRTRQAADDEPAKPKKKRTRKAKTAEEN